jgi:hypothetical protein
LPGDPLRELRLVLVTVSGVTKRHAKVFDGEAARKLQIAYWWLSAVKAVSDCPIIDICNYIQGLKKRVAACLGMLL